MLAGVKRLAKLARVEKWSLIFRGSRESATNFQRIDVARFKRHGRNRGLSPPRPAFGSPNSRVAQGRNVDFGKVMCTLCTLRYAYTGCILALFHFLLPSFASSHLHVHCVNRCTPIPRRFPPPRARNRASKYWTGISVTGCYERDFCSRFVLPLSLSVFKGDYRYVYSIPEFYLDISGGNLSSLHFDVPCFCILICFFLFRLNRAREKDLFLSNKIIHDVTTVARIVETDDELMTHPIWVNKLFTRCQSTCVDRIGGLIIIIIILL